LIYRTHLVDRGVKGEMSAAQDGVGEDLIDAEAGEGAGAENLEDPPEPPVPVDTRIYAYSSDEDEQLYGDYEGNIAHLSGTLAEAKESEDLTRTGELGGSDFIATGTVGSLGTVQKQERQRQEKFCFYQFGRSDVPFDELKSTIVTRRDSGDKDSRDSRDSRYKNSGDSKAGGTGGAGMENTYAVKVSYTGRKQQPSKYIPKGSFDVAAYQRQAASQQHSTRISQFRVDPLRFNNPTPDRMTKL